MADSWGSVFDSFGLKTVTRTDKDKGAYLPNEEQRAALAAAGFYPGIADDENLIEIEVLGESGKSLVTSYYRSLRVGSGRDPEPRMGRGLVAWAKVGDELVIGNVGSRVFVARTAKITPEEARASFERRVTQAFKPRARLLQLLGDQLIGSSKLAVFELVKNAYDADASEVSITLGDLGTADPWIMVEDDGVGMSLDTIQNVWLVPTPVGLEALQVGKLQTWMRPSATSMPKSSATSISPGSNCCRTKRSFPTRCCSASSSTAIHFPKTPSSSAWAWRK